MASHTTKYEKLDMMKGAKVTETTTTIVPLNDLQPLQQASTTLTHEPYVHKERALWLKLVLLLIDVILAASPLLFVGIAIAAIVFNKKPITSDRDYVIGNERIGFTYTVSGGDMIIQTARVAVSIFPILFAAIAGRFLKAYALHRAEKGSQMGVLEQLYGSQSLSNAVQLCFALKGPGLIGIGVVVLWLLSPIGGQGVQRVLGRTTTSTLADTTVYYADTSSNRTMFASRRAAALAMPAMNALFASALLTDRLSDTSNDVWGNVRIPFLDTLGSKSNTSDWIPFDPESNSSSFVGVIIDNVVNNTSSTFNLSTSYVTLECQDAVSFAYTPPDFSGTTDGYVPGNMTGYQRFLEWLGPLLVNQMTNNTVNSVNETGATMWSDWQYLLDVRSNGSYVSDDNATVATYFKPPQITFASQAFGTSETYVSVIKAYECTARVNWVEANIYCAVDSLCQLIQMRGISQPQAVSADGIFTEFMGYPAEPGPIVKLLSFLDNFDSFRNYGVNVWGPASTVSSYMAGSGVYGTQMSVVNDTAIAAGDVASRLGKLINTAWLISLQYTNLASSGITNTTLLSHADVGSPDYSPYDEGGLTVDLRSTPAKATTSIGIYQTNWAWVAIALFISFLLLALGVMGLYYRHTNRHPDVLGFVSTLVRDNPNFESPPQAEKLDGLEMASYYKHTVVQLVSVGDDVEDSARITLRKHTAGQGHV